MQNLFQEINNPLNLFLLLGLVFIFSELFIGINTGFELVLLGSIFILSSIVGIVFGNITIMFILIIVLSIIYFFYGRKMIKKQIIVLTHKTNIDNLIGRTAIVTKNIDKHEAGRVKIDNEEWRAVSSGKFDAGDKVKINSVEGVSVVVEKIEK
ncbi:hypothetical protein GYA19_04995 [Candidatus Beckwithbacteria bacterium]|nr:hypothetical protein [Candidatus Beckwithbacteria bacterium]